jgi:hypothetical protein
MLLAFALSCMLVHAQATQGSVVGSVKDPNGSVVPNAMVTLTNIAEGTQRTARTSATGDYQFLDVKAGQYQLEITATGFSRWQATAVALAVRQELRLDAKLAVGAVQQQIEVTGENVSAIQTETPTISASFTAAEADSLPVNTRASFSGTSAAGILGTLPGVQDDSSGFSLQGALPYQLDVTVDGVTSKDATGGNFLSDTFPSTESISEIRADGVMANAEFGNPAQIVVTTKGGTNTLHGSGFFYYQDSAFDAIPYTYPTTTEKASVTGKTFGGSAGGPVFLPHIYNGHNKSFFFGAYEGWRHPAKETVFEVVPTAAMKQGDFSAYCIPDGKGGCIPFTLMNPATGTPFPDNKIPAGINTIAQNTLTQFYPDPNTGNTAAYIDDGTPNYQSNVDVSGRSNQFDVRGDQYFGSNQKFLVWGKFTWKNFPINGKEPLLVPSSENTSQNRALKVDTNWTITPYLINEAGFGFTRYTSGSTNSFDGKAWTNAQGWQGLQNLFYNGIPEMDFNHIQSLNADRLTGLKRSLTYDYSDTLIWTKGRHTMKFGVNVQTLEAITPLGFNGSDNYGTYYFNTSGSVGAFTGVDFADFLLGIPNASFYDVVQQDNDGISGHYHFFGQDEWRISSRLTLSYGLRYELHPGYYDRYGDIGNFDPSVALSGRVIYPQGKQALLAQSYLASANACNPDGINKTNDAIVNGAPCMPVEGNSTAGFPAGLKKYPHFRFMPRLGFAYRPLANDKWAVRGGFGFYQINMLGSSFYSLTGTVQAQTQAFVNSYDPATHTIGFQWPQINAGSGGAAGVGGYGTDYFGTANSIDWKDPYTMQWSLSADHDLGSGYAVRASYIGSGTRQLVWAPDENTLPFSTTVSAFDQPLSARLFPNWGRINTRATGANSSYQSFQADASHRLQAGMEFHSTFTYANAMADNTGPANVGFGGEGGGNRATSILNRHADYGHVYGTRRLRWNTTGLFDLPFGRGKLIGSNMSRLADSVVGGWRLASILTMQTGAYITPSFPSGQEDPSGTGSGLTTTAAGWDPGHRNQYADRVTGVSTKPRAQGRLNWINAGAFGCPGDNTWTVGSPCLTGSGSGPHPLPIGRFGNSPNGVMEGPGLINLSAGLSKTFVITERVRLKAEGTFTNVLNHINLGDPYTDLSSSNVGIVSSSIGSDFGGARTGQIALRAEF